MTYELRIQLENKKAAEEPPKKKRKRFGGIEAEDMTPVTTESAEKRPGWKVSTLGRITKPIKMRPEHPLPEMIDEKPKMKPGVVKFSDVNKPVGVTEKQKKKRAKDPDTRARRKVIDMTKYGSTHLKGMFLDLEVPMPTNRPERYQDKRPDERMEDSDDSESSEIDGSPATIPAKPAQKSPHKVATVEADAGPSNVPSESIPPKSPTPLASSKSIPISQPTLFPTTVSPPKSSRVPPASPKKAKLPASPPEPAATPAKLIPSTIPDNDVDIQREKTQSLNLLNSLFGNDADDWVGQEEIDSDIDVSELVKGDRMLVEEDVEFEVVPKNAPVKSFSAPAVDEESDEESEEMEVDQPAALPTPSTASPVKDAKPKTLKDLFAPREEDGEYSLPKTYFLTDITPIYSCILSSGPPRPRTRTRRGSSSSY